MSYETIPLPWRHYKGEVDGEAVHEINDAEGGTAGYAFSEADARLIVTAVNHHDELALALADVLRGPTVDKGAARRAQDLLARIAKERGE